ncbi:hypothetical protein CTAYLR_006993 [Chrysophaeum taylorii]|uniref:Calpain catalytic domain-containing protein n=1 Tax=Chrysophaeum taylorii TaxID=2483200 RepID=A0AAD7UAN2_9STRA|nr:hypothetical protein CTAYLR_006993 [Chrysophaeum taylorii]
MLPAEGDGWSEEEGVAKLREVRAECEARRKWFVDVRWSDSSWMRPEELQFDGEKQIRGIELNMRGSWTVIREAPRPQDVVWGRMGFTWLTSTIASLCAFCDGKIVERLFVESVDEQQQQQHWGAHGVRFYVGGAWRVAVLDELLPVAGDGRKACIQLKYAMCRRRQLWLSLAEKGFAKLRGGYGALVTEASIGRALYAATGWPCTEKKIPADDEALCHDVADAVAAGFVACLGSKADKALVGGAGLAAQHAYAVLSVFEVVVQGKLLQLVRVCDPRASKSWTGEWREGSPSWTSDVLRRRAEHERETLDRPLLRVSKDVSSFYATPQELRTYFATIAVCEYRDDEWREVRLAGRTRGDAFVVSGADAAADMTLELAQPPPDPNGIVREALALAVFAGSSATTTTTRSAVAETVARVGTQAFCRCRVEAGASYLVVPIGGYSDDTEATLVVRSGASVDVERVDAAPATRRRAVLAYARNAATTKTIGDAKFHTRTDGNVYFVVAENRARSKWLKVILYFTKLRGYKVSRPTLDSHPDVQEDHVAAVVSHVPPNHAALLCVATPDSLAFRYEIGKKISYVDGPSRFEPPLVDGPDDLHQPESLRGDDDDDDGTKDDSTTAVLSREEDARGLVVPVVAPAALVDHDSAERSAETKDELGTPTAVPPRAGASATPPKKQPEVVAPHRNFRGRAEPENNDGRARSRTSTSVPPRAKSALARKSTRSLSPAPRVAARKPIFSEPTRPAKILGNSFPFRTSKKTKNNSDPAAAAKTKARSSSRPAANPTPVHNLTPGPPGRSGLVITDRNGVDLIADL